MTRPGATTKLVISVLCFAAFSFSGCKQSAPTLPLEPAVDSKKPVAYWAFEDNGQDSAGGHHLAIGMGAPNQSPYAEGKIGRAMNQRGNAPGFITPRTSDMDFNQDFTIGIWAYREDSIYDNDAILDTGSIYLAKRDASPWNSKIGAFLYANEFKQQVEVVDNSSFAQPPLHTWFHVILFRKGNTVGIKVNNQGTAVIDAPSFNTTGGAMIFIGIQQYGYPWQGRLDELGIWNRALTDQEMADLYNDGAGRHL